MVKNEEMHFIDSDDQEEKTAGEKKPEDKWAIQTRIYYYIDYR